MKAPDPPRLVFTAVMLADGDWERVLLLRKKADMPVIVVPACLDARFCLATLARGAFDCIVPPFDQDDVCYVFSNATWRIRPAATPRGSGSRYLETERNVLNCCDMM